LQKPQQTTNNKKQQQQQKTKLGGDGNKIEKLMLLS